AIKLTALLFSLVHVGAAAVLALRTLERRAAICAALYLAAAPLLLTLWSLKLRGGFVSIWALGTLLLLVAHAQATHGATVKGSLLLGLLAGISTWVNFLVFPWIAAAGLYLLSRRQVFSRAATFGVCAAGFALGSLPLWAWNLTHDWATFRQLLGGGGGDGLAHLGVLVRRHVPMLLGTLPSWSDPATLPTFARLADVGLLIAAAVFLYAARRDLARFVTLSREPTSGAELYVLVALGFLACAWFTRFGGDDEPRYATVLYAFIAPAIGVAAARLSRGLRAAGVVAFGLVLVLNADSIYLRDRRLPAQPLHFVRDGTIVPADLSPSYEALRARGVEAVEVEYWLGYRMIYETDERLVTFPGRYEPYLARFAEAARRAWVFRDGGHEAWRARAKEEELRQLGLGPERLELQGLVVLLAGDEGLDPRGWRATASHEKEPVRRAFDRNDQSRWTTGVDQAPGQWLQVDLGAEQRLDALAVAFADNDQPARLQIDLSRDGSEWTHVYEGSPRRIFRIALGSLPARHLRLTQLGERRGRWWSVQELYVFTRDSGADGAQTP
ncbi:MAG: discoidin domain-containing protein, partial [Myxococcales bacterium]